ncbi:MAG: hypothetical protein IIW17_04620, partial [Clostridia bacterium]|nr:hypothetical protein [Clostridia bacterium]
MDGVPLPAPHNGSAALQAVVLKACAYDPDKRYQSAGEMLQALETLGRTAVAESEFDDGDLTVRASGQVGADYDATVSAAYAGGVAEDGTYRESERESRGNRTDDFDLQELDRKQIEETLEKISRELQQENKEPKKKFSLFNAMWGFFKAVVLTLFLALLAVGGYAAYTAYGMLQSGLAYSIGEDATIIISGCRDDSFTRYEIPEKIAWLPV